MATAAVPSVMRALMIQEGDAVAVEQRPVPTLAENEVLVKVEAIAINPTDWKHVYLYSSTPGTILGCDFSGRIAKLGKRAKGNLALGDHVVGFVQGGYFSDRGAFAEYVKIDSELVWVVPKGTLSHEEASTMGCALYTVIQMLYHPTRMGMVAPPSKVSSESWFFVYGGSTSVGLFAIQLARISGYKIVAVASPRNHALLKSFGASAVFDYRSPDVVEQIKRATGGNLHLGLDAHCGRSSQLLSVRAFGPGPGKLGIVQGPDYNARRARPDVALKHTLIYTALGHEFDLHGHTVPVAQGDRAQVVQFLPQVGGLVKAGVLKPNPVKFWEGGLEHVDDGFRYMMEGRVSGEKIVFKVPA